MRLDKSRILITGVAGFIGAALSKELLKIDVDLVGIDNLNSYYDVNLKKARLRIIDDSAKVNLGRWRFYQKDISNHNSLIEIFDSFKPSIVVHLAAQAGVRYSLINPKSYLERNLIGFCNVLELCRQYNILNFLYASSSSVYGGNREFPYKENQEVNHPISFYAATKRSNELIAHSYSHLYGIPSTGLRFFTVYGPWGRPDMAPMIFVNSILNKKPIDIFNYGNMKRDFTYIDDVVEGIYRCCLKPATPNENFDYLNPDGSSSFAPHRIFNLGNSNPVNLSDFIQIIEEELGIKAIKNYKELQPGDVISTAADITKLRDWVGFSPEISINTGIQLFVKWFKDYYLKR